jgi:hypothetical protein
MLSLRTLLCVLALVLGFALATPPVFAQDVCTAHGCGRSYVAPAAHASVRGYSAQHRGTRARRGLGAFLRSPLRVCRGC